jgi:hypothetical protein
MLSAKSADRIAADPVVKRRAALLRGSWAPSPFRRQLRQRTPLTLRLSSITLYRNNQPAALTAGGTDQNNSRTGGTHAGAARSAKVSNRKSMENLYGMRILGHARFF